MSSNLLNQINPYILLVISAAFAWASSVTSNAFSKWIMPNNREINLGIIIKQCTGIAVILLLYGIPKVSLPTFLLSAAFGLCVVIGVFVSQIALNIGPMSIFVMITSSGTMLNALSGAVFWNEKLTWQKIVGMIGILIMMFLFVGKNRDDKKVGVRFLAATLLVTISSVAVGFCQKIQQDSPQKDETGGFLVIGFIFSLIATLLVFFYQAKRSEKIEHDFSVKSKAFWISVAGGVSYGAIHSLNLFLVGALDSAVFFPCANGLPMILSVLAAVALFKEHLTLKETVGVIIGIVSVFFIGLKF